MLLHWSVIHYQMTFKWHSGCDSETYWVQKNLRISIQSEGRQLFKTTLSTLFLYPFVFILCVSSFYVLLLSTLFSTVSAFIMMDKIPLKSASFFPHAVLQFNALM